MLALRFTRRPANHVTTVARKRLVAPANIRRGVMPDAPPARAVRRRRERTGGWGLPARRSRDRSGSSDGERGADQSPSRTGAPTRRAVAALHPPGAGVA